MRQLLTCLLATFSLASVANAMPEDLEAWHAIDSQNFVIFTDTDPDRGVELARNLELFRATFARLAPGLELRAAVPTTLIAFRDRRSYAPYKSQPDSGGSTILGQFLIHPDRNFLTLDASAQIGHGFAVIYHEFVHYLVAHNFHQVPRWFHEGLAEYYSTFTIEDDTIIVGRPVERHLRWLRYDNDDRKVRALTHDFSLRALLTGESGHHGQRAGGFYALSWALVHHLLSGDSQRLDQMVDFLVRLRDDEDPDQAFESAFDIHLDDLEDTLRDYAYRPAPTPDTPATEIDKAFHVARFDVADMGADAAASATPVSPADVLFSLGDLQLRLGRMDAAEAHFQIALDYSLDHAESLAGLAWIRDHQSRFAEADVLYRDALGVGSTDPLTYVRYGRHLLAKVQPGDGGLARSTGDGDFADDQDPDERRANVEQLAHAARESFAAASDLDGDFAEARALFGKAHLFGRVDPSPGIKALRKARFHLPDRDDLTLSLIQLHLKDEDFAAARRLLNGDLREHAEETAVLWAEEEIERAELLHAATEALEKGEHENALAYYDQAIAVTSDQNMRDRMAAKLAALQEHYGSP